MSPSMVPVIGGALLVGGLLSLPGCSQEKRGTEKPGPQGWVGTTEPTAALPVPFVVDDHFHPSNCFDGGACETVAFNAKGCGPGGLERPEAAQGQCYGFVYRPASPDGFGGIFFVHDSLGESNWGEEEGRAIEPGAKKMSFFAAAPDGSAPRVYFKVGGIESAENPYRDNLKLEQPIVLGPQFQKYEISLEGQSYDKVISAFGWAMLGQDGLGPFKFFVDDVRWE